MLACIVSCDNINGMVCSTCLHSIPLQQGAETECLKALIAFGANVNPLNAFGQTPLDLASMATTMGESRRLATPIGPHPLINYSHTY